MTESPCPTMLSHALAIRPSSRVTCFDGRKHTAWPQSIKLPLNKSVLYSEKTSKPVAEVQEKAES